MGKKKPPREVDGQSPAAALRKAIGVIIQEPIPRTHLAPDAQARAQLFSLYKDGLQTGEWLELRILDCRKEPARFIHRDYFRSVTSLVDAAMKWRSRYDVFVGVGLRRCPLANIISECPHEERGADHVSRLPAVWADLDVKSADEPNKPHESLDEILEMLRSTAPIPSMLVASGTGIHAYWTFDKPISDLERVVKVNKRIRDTFKGDNAIDSARVLRLAGTLNYKHGQPLPVSLIEDWKAE